VERGGRLGQVRSAAIGQFLAFDVSPQRFDGIQIRSVPVDNICVAICCYEGRNCHKIDD